MSAKFKCHACRGKGVTGFMGCSGFSVWRECSLCDGTGVISAEVRDRALKALELRDARVRAGVSIREIAKLAAIKPSRVSDIERGRVEPTALELSAYERLGAT